MRTLLGHIGAYFSRKIAIFWTIFKPLFCTFKCHFIPLRRLKVKNMTKIYQEMFICLNTEISRKSRYMWMRKATPCSKKTGMLLGYLLLTCSVFSQISLTLQIEYRSITRRLIHWKPEQLSSTRSHASSFIRKAKMLFTGRTPIAIAIATIWGIK